MSAKTGVKPRSAMVSAVATNVNGVVITSSPGRRSSAISERSRASVPLLSAIPNRTPLIRAISLSSSAVAGVRPNIPVASTSRTAASISLFSAAYCAGKSAIETFITFF
jgi:hypothetical protein